MDEQERATSMKNAVAKGAQAVKNSLGMDVVRGYSAALLSSRTDLQEELEHQVIGTQPRTVAEILGANLRNEGEAELTLIANPHGAQDAARLILMQAAIDALISSNVMSGRSSKVERISEQADALFQSLLTGHQAFTYLQADTGIVPVADLY